jgi:DUF4097 and DUF4098 domain-containing protein YvlB
MKPISVLITILFIASLACGQPSAPVTQGGDDDLSGASLERTVAAEPNVVVTVCLASGDVIVHGWDRNEVHASSTDAEQLDLRRGIPTATGPASRVDLIISNKPGDDASETCDCSASSDVELDVPRGATVQVKTRDGEVQVSDITVARVETLSGDISVRGVTKGVEALSVSGEVSLENSGGSIRMRSISGSIEATNARTVEANDDFDADSVSGDVSLDQVSHAHVRARTISGAVNLTGPLARGGRYEFKTTSGDVTFMLPGDASFRVTARIPRGEIITDFSLKAAGGPSPTSNSHVLTGTYGTGDAILDLYSYSGTVRLRRNSK